MENISITVESSSWEYCCGGQPSPLNPAAGRWASSSGRSEELHRYKSIGRWVAISRVQCHRSCQLRSDRFIIIMIGEGRGAEEEFTLISEEQNRRSKLRLAGFSLDCSKRKDLNHKVSSPIHHQLLSQHSWARQRLLISQWKTNQTILTITIDSWSDKIKTLSSDYFYYQLIFLFIYCYTYYCEIVKNSQSARLSSGFQIFVQPNSPKY